MESDVERESEDRKDMESILDKFSEKFAKFRRKFCKKRKRTEVRVDTSALFSAGLGKSEKEELSELRNPLLRSKIFLMLIQASS